MSVFYDCIVKIWVYLIWVLLKTLVGYEGKVMGIDIFFDLKYIVIVLYDRIFKLWTIEM